MAEQYPKYKPGTTTGTSFVSPGAGVYQAPATSLTAARGAYQPAPISGKSARPVLDQILAEYTSRGEGMAGQLPGQIQERAAAGRQAPAPRPEDPRGSLLEELLGQMYTTSGGPNAALIAQYNAQKKQLQDNYSQNKADANNLYGQLSTDIETYGAGLQQRYTTDIEGMATTQAERQQGLADLQAQRDTTRAEVAASLGIGVEDAQTPQSSAIQEIAGLSSAAASNWENLFKANKLLADASTGRQVAGAKATQADQLMAMKRFLDAQSQAIDSQIAMERMRPVTQELTDVGKALRSLEVDQLVSQAQAAFPERYGAGKEETKTDLLEGMSNAQKNISALYGQVLSQDQILEEFYEISRKKMESQMYGPSEESQLTPLQIIISNSLNFRESDFG